MSRQTSSFFSVYTETWPCVQPPSKKTRILANHTNWPKIGGNLICEGVSLSRRQPERPTKTRGAFTNPGSQSHRKTVDWVVGRAEGDRLADNHTANQSSASFRYHESNDLMAILDDLVIFMIFSIRMSKKNILENQEMGGGGDSVQWIFLQWQTMLTEIFLSIGSPSQSLENNGIDHLFALNFSSVI